VWSDKLYLSSYVGQLQRTHFKLFSLLSDSASFGKLVRQSSPNIKTRQTRSRNHLTMVTPIGGWRCGLRWQPQFSRESPAQRPICWRQLPRHDVPRRQRSTPSNAHDSSSKQVLPRKFLIPYLMVPPVGSWLYLACMKFWANPWLRILTTKRQHSFWNMYVEHLKNLLESVKSYWFDQVSVPSIFVPTCFNTNKLIGFALTSSSLPYAAFGQVWIRPCEPVWLVYWWWACVSFLKVTGLQVDLN
jgi:hypothetical protein